MTLPALHRVSFIFPRIFLRICRWVLVSMSLNFKLKKSKESMNGSNHVWGWRVQLLFLGLLSILFGTICFFLSMNSQVLWRDETSMCPQKDKLLFEHFNVSKDQLHALASNQISSLQFTGRIGYKMACTMKVVCSEEDIEDQHGLVIQNDDFQYQCPVRYDNIPRKLSLSLLEEESSASPSHAVSLSISTNSENFEENLLDTRANHCEGSLLCLVKACWWILVGLVLSCVVSSLCEKVWNYPNQKLVQPQEATQERQKKQVQTRSSIKSTGSVRKKFLVVLFIMAIVGPFYLYPHFSNDIKLKLEENLATLCDQRARMLQDQFNVSMNHVHALAILVSTFHHGKQPSAIDQKTFGEYTERTSFERPLTSGVSYALRVLHSEREQFEKQQGWIIKKMGTEDQTLVQDGDPKNMDPSPPRDEYAPVIFSQETVSHIVSVDMMSGKEDRENILRARASGKGVLTPPFKLLKSNHLGVVLTFAVYNTHLPPDATPEQRINATVGYLGASYDVPSLVDKLLRQLASEQTIAVNVYDTTDKDALINMYGTRVIDTGLVHISSLDFGDPARRHEMHCRFNEKPPPPWTAIMYSAGFFVITFLVFSLLWQADKRIGEVERDFHEMMLLKHRAEAADVAKSQFLATVSHEIRTPMNGVLGMLQILMDTDLSATQLDYAQTAHASGEDLISLINEVLDQAKIESGRLELETVPFDLRSVLDKVLSLLSGKSHEKGIELAVYVSDQVPSAVVGDPGRFRQIINNLVGNSIKFIQGKGHIFVSVHVADEVRAPDDITDQVLKQSITSSYRCPDNQNNTFSGFPVVERWKSWEKFKNLTSDGNFINDNGKIKLLITVEDTGEGITEEAQSRIFTPFMQADSSTSRTHGGTGIGLSISKRLVELMGGEIGFVSEPGTGSTFSFTVVFGKGEKDCLDTSTSRQPYDSSIEKLRGLRALVVDDKSIRAEVTKYHLQRLGISANVASSLDSACAYLSNSSSSSVSSSFSMVLVDKVLWDTDASLSLQHLLKEFRRNSRTQIPENLLRVFLLATSLSQTERNELKSAGLVDDVLMKPLRLSVLVSCFEDVLGIVRRRQVNQDRTSNVGILRNKRILVVDDHVVNRRVAEATLKKLGANVTCIDSGKASLPMLKPPHNFDACFMDIQMPEMDGFEATRRIRASEREVNERIKSGEESAEMYANVDHWYVPILAMTADVIQATTEERVNCGMDDYVTKPIEEKKLYAAIARFFGSNVDDGKKE